MPNRPRSYRGPPADIISMAQHASPNAAGHIDALCALLASFSTLASRIPLGSFSSAPIAGHPLLLIEPVLHRAARHQSHSRPPRRQTYAYATKTAPMKSSISTSPNNPSASKCTAQGYRNTISMSKMMKSIATR